MPRHSQKLPLENEAQGFLEEGVEKREGKRFEEERMGCNRVEKPQFGVGLASHQHEDFSVSVVEVKLVVLLVLNRLEVFRVYNPVGNSPVVQRRSRKEREGKAAQMERLWHFCKESDGLVQIAVVFVRVVENHVVILDYAGEFCHHAGCFEKLGGKERAEVNGLVHALASALQADFHVSQA